jgi:hypothetical protein
VSFELRFFRQVNEAQLEAHRLLSTVRNGLVVAMAMAMGRHAE